VTYLSSPRAEPFGSTELTVEARARSIGLFSLRLTPPRPLQGWLISRPGPEHNRYVPVTALFRTRLSAAFDGYLLMNSLVV
jgi:hypothetical protein